MAFPTLFPTGKIILMVYFIIIDILLGAADFMEHVLIQSLLAITSLTS